MPILDYAKKLSPNLSDQEAVLTYLDSRSADLETDTQNRLFGTKNKSGSGYRRAGYNILRDFFEGDQWFTTREEGATMKVTNFVRMTVDNYTFFMTQDQPEIDVPPRDPLDDVENARVHEVEKLITEIFDDNQWFNIFFAAVQNGSLLGDSIIVGPFYDEQRGKIWMKNVKRPEYIRIVWKSEDYDEILGYMFYYYLAPEAAQSMFGDKLAALGIDIRTIVGSEQTATAGLASTGQQTMKQRVAIRDFWDENIHLVAINNRIIEYKVHNQGFIPIVHVPNIPHPTEPWGISDAEDLLDPQKSYNELTSDMQDIVRQVAFASIFGKNLDVEEIQSGVAKIYDLGDESEVFGDPRNTNYPFLQGFLGDLKGEVDITSGMPDLFQGGKSVQNVSGRALSVLMTPINNRVRSKENRWAIAIKQIVKNMELLVEKYIPNGDLLIQHWYKVDVFFPGTLVRDVTDELNKFIQKVQSQVTTMKNIGIASPKDEQVLMKKELSDAQIAIEISRNPQLQVALIQQAVAAAQQKAQAGAANAAAAAGPTLNNGQNQPGDQPASAPGNPTGTSASPGGAVAAAASAGGAAPLIPNS